MAAAAAVAPPAGRVGEEAEAEEEVQRRIRDLRREIRAWEAEFAAAHGRRPTPQDVARLPEPKALYKEYRRLKPARPARVAAASASPSPSARSGSDATATKGTVRDIRRGSRSPSPAAPFALVRQTGVSHLEPAHRSVDTETTLGKAEPVVDSDYVSPTPLRSRGRPTSDPAAAPRAQNRRVRVALFRDCAASAEQRDDRQDTELFEDGRAGTRGFSEGGKGTGKTASASARPTEGRDKAALWQRQRPLPQPLRQQQQKQSFMPTFSPKPFRVALSRGKAGSSPMRAQQPDGDGVGRATTGGNPLLSSCVRDSFLGRCSEATSAGATTDATDVEAFAPSTAPSSSFVALVDDDGKDCPTLLHSSSWLSPASPSVAFPETAIPENRTQLPKPAMDTASGPDSQREALAPEAGHCCAMDEAQLEALAAGEARCQRSGAAAAAANADVCDSDVDVVDATPPERARRLTAADRCRAAIRRAKESSFEVRVTRSADRGGKHSPVGVIRNMNTERPAECAGRGTAINEPHLPPQSSPATAEEGSEPAKVQVDAVEQGRPTAETGRVVAAEAGLSKLTKAQLVARLRAMGVQSHVSMLKSQLLELLSETGPSIQAGADAHPPVPAMARTIGVEEKRMAAGGGTADDRAASARKQQRASPIESARPPSKRPAAAEGVRRIREQACSGASNVWLSEKSENDDGSRGDFASGASPPKRRRPAGLAAQRTAAFPAGPRTEARIEAGGPSTSGGGGGMKPSAGGERAPHAASRKGKGPAARAAKPKAAIRTTGTNFVRSTINGKGPKRRQFLSRSGGVAKRKSKSRFGHKGKGRFPYPQGKGRRERRQPRGAESCAADDPPGLDCDAAAGGPECAGQGGLTVQNINAKSAGRVSVWGADGVELGRPAAAAAAAGAGAVEAGGESSAAQEEQSTLESEAAESLQRAREVPSAENLTEVLRRVFGFPFFREGQLETIQRVLRGQSTLVILPTGAGKSLCYQLPALLLDGLVLVVSPLVALMMDQLRHLPPCLPGAALHSGQDLRAAAATLDRVRRGAVRVLFVSPERLFNPYFVAALRALPPLALAVVDEAHCVSEWSHNFRPSYLRLGLALRGTLAVGTILAMTATATKLTEETVCCALRIGCLSGEGAATSCPGDGGCPCSEEGSGPRNSIVRTRVLRTNLRLSVSHTHHASHAERLSALVELLRSSRFRGARSVIIYCSMRHQADDVARTLQAVGVAAESYHAGLSQRQRERVQERFNANKLRAVAATVAFGMGLDKADIQGIVHFSLPRSLEQYVQEIGRAGRNGEPAQCHLFLDDDDYVRLRSLSFSDGVEQPAIRRLLDRIFTGAVFRSGLSVAAPSDGGSGGNSGSNRGGDCGGEPTERMAGSLPIAQLTHSLDMREEVVSTILTNLEQQQPRLLRVLPQMSAVAEVFFHRTAPETLAARRPLVAAILKAAPAPRNGMYRCRVPDLANSVKASISAVDNELQQLRGLGEIDYSLQEESLCYEVEALPSDMDALAEQVTAHMLAVERSRVAKMDAMCAAAEAAIDAVKREDAGQGAQEEALHRAIEEYFNHGQAAASLDNASAGPPRALIKEASSLLLADIRALVRSSGGGGSTAAGGGGSVSADGGGRKEAAPLTPRAVARILHGLSSPAFPAQAWCKHAVWRRHMNVCFHSVMATATQVLRQAKAG